MVDGGAARAVEDTTGVRPPARVDADGDRPDARHRVHERRVVVGGEPHVALYPGGGLDR